MVQMSSAKGRRNAAWLQKLEHRRARVRSRLDGLWEKAKALDEAIKAAAGAGLPHDDLLAELEKLRRRSWELAERGEMLDCQLAESSVIDHGQRGAKWRPAAAEPF